MRQKIRKICAITSCSLDEDNVLYFSPRFPETFEKLVLEYYRKRKMYFVPFDDFKDFIDHKLKFNELLKD